jgi:hypothetical protein
MSLPQNFNSIIADFTKDLSVVFPEYSHKWQNLNMETVYPYCLAIFPERFFDILYSNADIFAKDSKINVVFLPNVDFRILYNCEGVSENTRNSIWKYLQLILFTLLGSVKDSKGFGKSANIFEAMGEDELQSKMAETLAGISDFFKPLEEEEVPDLMDASKFAETFGKTMDEMNDAFNKSEGAAEGSEDKSEGSGFKMPNPEELHEHMKGLLEGKLGKLAKEFTDEFTNDIQDIFTEKDTENIKSSKDILMQIIKNPQKMVLIFKKLAAKLQDKMKNGDISQEELMQEMTGIMEKMKGMGGGNGDLAELMKSMKDLPFMKMLEKTMGGKVDMNALNRMTSQTATKDRMKKKLEQRQQAKAMAQAQAQAQLNTKIIETGANNYVVKIGEETQEKSGLKPPSAQMSEDELVSMFNKTSEKKSKKSKKSK